MPRSLTAEVEPSWEKGEDHVTLRAASPQTLGGPVENERHPAKTVEAASVWRILKAQIGTDPAAIKTVISQHDGSGFRPVSFVEK